jgi:2-phosphosulfolactate phosphatase
MSRRVVIDCFPEAAARWQDGYAIVVIDVVRATTTAITAAASGRRCFPVASLDEAFELAATLDNPLLVGELGGIMPEGFHINNSPAAIAARTDIHRPAILLSSTGTRLCKQAGKAEAAFLACLRNHSAVARYLAREFPRVAVIGAGTRDEFREEDQMCCAWIAGSLMKAGYAAQDLGTAEIVQRWCDARPDAWVGGKSAGYLRRSGQLADLDFVLAHVDDLAGVYALRNDEVVAEPRAAAETQGAQELRYA